MYNRYIPQPDGSFRCNRPEPRKQPQKTLEPEKCEQTPPCPVQPCPREESCKPHPDHSQSSAAGFLRQLLPKNFDSGDLIIVLLLLLLAGDCEEDRSNALLTLVLYLFM